jgi:hypothetical protein
VPHLSFGGLIHPTGIPPRLTAFSSDWTPPPSQVTHPDQLPADAWRAIDLIDGEMPLRAWRTPQGFLVLTNLRCVALWQRGELFPPHPWRSGPEFFFYNLKPPRVLLHRYVELSEEFEENGWVGRFAVADPEGVAAEISAAIESGRAAWRDRRAHSEELIRARQRLRAARVAGSRPASAMVRCAFCGNLTNVSARRCASCGAALG